MRILELPPASLVHGARWVFIAAGLVALAAAAVTTAAKRGEERARAG